MLVGRRLGAGVTAGSAGGRSLLFEIHGAFAVLAGATAQGEAGGDEGECDECFHGGVLLAAECRMSGRMRQTAYSRHS